MTPEQAFNLLVQLAESAPAPKQVHIQAEQAAQVLKDLIDNSASAVPTMDVVAKDVSAE